MKKPHTLALSSLALLSVQLVTAESWVIDSQEDWTANAAQETGVSISDGAISPSDKSGTFVSSLKRFDKKKSAASMTFGQSPVWKNWNPIENIGPSNLGDAPVLLTVGPDNYWMFGRYSSGKRNQKNKGKTTPKAPPFVSEPATLEGFDIPLETTPFPNQYNAPGGLMPKLGGYHAWQSRDMVNWVHHGPVTEKFSCWVISAEHVDGKTMIYYDYPNDQDPHVYVDEDLTDGLPGKNMGIAFKDPSHGSDAGFIRDLEGKMHVIYEDWSPINASKRSWDSPLAGHAVSETGTGDFEILPPAVDHRTNPTGEIATYKHPHWLQHPDFDSNLGEYEVHDPEQQAYGDWAVICIGGQYYLFGDYDPAGSHKMSVGWFTTDSLDQEFEWCGNIGEGHPDPDICFAEGQFYLATQQKSDFVSPGPWVETVEARAGVDTDNDGEIDQWTEWQQVKESYDYLDGFSKQIGKTPASLDLSSLDEGYGFQFELKLTDSTDNDSLPILEKVEMHFSE